MCTCTLAVSTGSRRVLSGIKALLPLSMLGLRWSILQSLLHVVDGAIYRLLDEKGTYVKGRQFCQAKCLDLAKVTTKQDLEEMNAYLRMKKGPTFLGAHYNGTSYNWADGEPILMTNWAKGQPRHSNKKQCVGVRKRNIAWYTWDCEKSLFLLCGKTEFQCKLIIHPASTCTPGRSISVRPAHSMGQIFLSDCARKYLHLWTCNHLIVMCKLYNDKSTNGTTNTINMEVWMMK